MARIPFVRHRTANQIRAKYRACRHPGEKTRWHALWLLARTDHPRAPAQVAGPVGLSDVLVRAVLHRWSPAGPDGVADGRKTNGSDPTLTRAGGTRCTLLSRSGRRTAGCGPGRRWPGTPAGGGGSRSGR